VIALGLGVLILRKGQDTLPRINGVQIKMRDILWGEVIRQLGFQSIQEGEFILFESALGGLRLRPWLREASGGTEVLRHGRLYLSKWHGRSGCNGVENTGLRGLLHRNLHRVVNGQE
jgi:hypothetical protein